MSEPRRIFRAQLICLIRKGDDVVGCLDPARWFYNDLPQEEQQHLVTHIKPHALVYV